MGLHDPGCLISSELLHDSNNVLTVFLVVISTIFCSLSFLKILSTLMALRFKITDTSFYSKEFLSNLYLHCEDFLFEVHDVITLDFELMNHSFRACKAH